MKKLSPYVYLFATGHFSVDWAQGAIPALLPYFISSCNLSYQDAATLIFANMLLSSVSQPIFGYYSDKVSKPWFAPLGPVLCGLCLTLLAFTQNYWFIFLCSMFSGFGSSGPGDFLRRRQCRLRHRPHGSRRLCLCLRHPRSGHLRHRQCNHRLHPLSPDAAHLSPGQRCQPGRKTGSSRRSPDQRLERVWTLIRRHLRPFRRLYGL